jgi:hypothetical protein
MSIPPSFPNVSSNSFYDGEMNYTGSNTNLKTNTFSNDDYKPILNSAKQGLGNITLTELIFHEAGIVNHSIEYPELTDDLVSGALNISYIGSHFAETIQIAEFDNLNDNIERSDLITVVMNESISVQYNSSIDNSEGFLIYNPRLYPREITGIFVQNYSSPIIEELGSETYSIDTDGYIKFNFVNYFNSDFNNFSMYIIYELPIELLDWKIAQGEENILEMSVKEETFSPTFSYNFTILVTKYNDTLGLIPADNLYIRLYLEPLDKELFYDHYLIIDGLYVDVDEYLEADNSLNCTMIADGQYFFLKFKLDFTMRFISPVGFTWAIDRLIEGRENRERIYLPQILEGPSHIFLHNVSFIEKTITIDQVEGTESLFGRTVSYSDILISISQQSVEYSLIFTENAVKRKGLKVVIPYIITGETVPFIIKYRASNNLRIVLTDNINMPLIGSRIELYYYDKPYGTYISNNFTQPMAPAYSDENGEIFLRNVPNGNYTIKIYQSTQLIKVTLINTFSQIVIVKSDIIHFPLWILIFGGISLIFVLLGLWFYINNKKRS